MIRYIFYAFSTNIYIILDHCILFLCLCNINLASISFLEFKIKLLIPVTGPRRINILMKRGGSALRRHMIRILAECRLQDTEFRRANIDEQGTVLIDVVELYCLNMMMFLELCLRPGCCFIVVTLLYDITIKWVDVFNYKLITSWLWYLF
jgi:hypothetical protein